MPDMPTGLMRGIPVRGITSVGVLQRQGQRLGTARNNDQVHVVGHEAVAEKTQLVEVRVAPQQFEIHPPFAVRRQQELPRVSALRHMMRNIYDSDTGKARHHLARISENVPPVLWFSLVLACDVYFRLAESPIYRKVTSMQTPAHLGWETAFIAALRTHLNVVIPSMTLLVKILVRIFSRDEAKEIFRSFFNLPLEFMLIATSFMLGALCGISDTYAARFTSQSDADLFAAVIIAVMFFGSIPINKLTRFTMVLAEKLYTAVKQYSELTRQPLLPGAEPDTARVGRIMWAMVYCILMVLVLLSSFGASISALAYVLHLIQ